MTDTQKGKPKKAAQTKRKIAHGLWQLNTNLYEIRVRGTNAQTGKMYSRWRQFQGTRMEAFAEHARLQDELRTAPPPQPRAAKKATAQPTTSTDLRASQEPETLATFALSWLGIRLARGDWRETTAEKYAVALDLHILPMLGRTPLEELKARSIEHALTEWAKKYERSTVNGWLRALRTLLNDAMADGLIAHNPAARVRALRERSGEAEGDEDDWANALSPTELDAYLRSWKALHPEHLPLIVTLVLTGLRWGEASALMWTDIEAAETNGVLRIRRSHVRGIVRNTTKTGKRRVVPFPPELATVLREHRQRMVEEQHPGLQGGWVFANSAGKPKDNGALYQHNRKVLKHAGITKRVTIHGLRRTATDLLRRASVDPVTAKAIIGHTTDRMREHYSTVGQDEARAIGASLISLVPAVGKPSS
jgi:integrase